MEVTLEVAVGESSKVGAATISGALVLLVMGEKVGMEKELAVGAQREPESLSLVEREIEGEVAVGFASPILVGHHDPGHSPIIFCVGFCGFSIDAKEQ